MKTYNLLLIIALMCVVSACRKDTPALYNPNEERVLYTPSQIFTAFWHGMNNSYVFWDIDPTDWDKVYDEYLPRFKALDSQVLVSTHELKMMYTELSKNLIDHHLSIVIKNNRAHRDSVHTFLISPSQDEIATRDYYHSNKMSVDALMVPIRKNIQDGRITSLTGGASVYDRATGKEMEAYSYNIDDGVAYIYLSDFLITGVRSGTNSAGNEPVLQAVNNFHEMVIGMPNLKGVIVDMRNNGGGYLNDMNYIVAPMLGEELLMAYSKSKNGSGRLDYTPWLPCIIPPAKTHRKVEVPIVALADLYSVSMSEMTSLAILELPNGYMVGERTYGATSPLTGLYDYNYGGTFQNKAMYVYTASLIFKRVDGTIIEGIGVTPDVEVLYDEQSMLNGVDKQLERALQLIEEKSAIK